MELAEVEEGVLLLESEVEEVELSLADFATVSGFGSEEDLESLVDLESELSLLELLLPSAGGFGRP